MMFWEEKCPYWECRERMTAVGWIAMNRVDNGNFGGTNLQSVLNKPRAFQGYEENKDKDPTNKSIYKNQTEVEWSLLAWGWAIELAPSVYNKRGPDPTGGALFFGNGEDIRRSMEACHVKYNSISISGEQTLYFSVQSYFCETPTPKP